MLTIERQGVVMRLGAGPTGAAEGAGLVRSLGGGAILARPVYLPGLDDVRAILTVIKERQTPAIYPRGGGAPARRPLL